MTSRPVVVLSTPEIMLAANAGMMRRVQNIKNGLATRPTYGAGQDNAWTLDIEGACGELAVAKWLGAYWSGAIGNLSADDVGPLQVRTTSHPNGRLLLHDRDRSDRVYIHVRGTAPTYTLVGWMRGADGKRPSWWRELQPGRPAYAVPDEALHSMGNLHRYLARERAA